jgi:release factor glutamine methyltransferase
MVINSDKAIAEMKALGIMEADIRDLFRYRYGVDYDQTKTGRLFMMPERCASDMEVLAAGYPPAYLIGFVPFFHLKVKVNQHVLIPRPETEEMMSLIEERQKHSLIHNALDLCCGSGCVALALKKIFPEATVFASDFSPYAVQMTQVNADENKEEIYIALSDYLDYFLNKDIKFDLIACNPPYIKNGELLDQSLSYEPQEALYSGEDGLDSYRRIFSDLDKVLADHGVAYFEIEAANAQETMMLAQQTLKSYRAELIKDMSGKDRFIRLTRIYL